MFWRRRDTLDARCTNHRSVSCQGFLYKSYWGVVRDQFLRWSCEKQWNFCMSASCKPVLRCISRRIPSGYVRLEFLDKKNIVVRSVTYPVFELVKSNKMRKIWSESNKSQVSYTVSSHRFVSFVRWPHSWRQNVTTKFTNRGMSHGGVGHDFDSGIDLWITID